MEQLPAGAKNTERDSSWRVTIAHYVYENGYGNVFYAGILLWEIHKNIAGDEYGAFSWGVLEVNTYKEIA